MRLADGRVSVEGLGFALDDPFAFDDHLGVVSRNPVRPSSLREGPHDALARVVRATRGTPVLLDGSGNGVNTSPNEGKRCSRE